MNSTPLWIVHSSHHYPYTRPKAQSIPSRSQPPKPKWFRNTSYTCNQKSLTKQQTRINKVLQSIMSNATNTLVQNYKSILADLQQVPNIRIKMADQEGIQKTKCNLIEANIDKIIKQGVTRNNIIQKQQEGYCEMYKIVTQLHNNQKQKQESIFIKSVSTNIESSCKIDSNKNSSRLFKTIRPSQIITGKDKLFYSVYKKSQHSEERKRQSEDNNRNTRLVNYQNVKIKTNQSNEKDKLADYRTSINAKPLKIAQQTAPHEDIIFKSRRTKQCPSKVLESKKIQLDIQEQGLIKLIQNKIENDCFGLILTNKSVYKKRMRTFYKG